MQTESENKTTFLSNVAFSALAWAIPLLLSFVATSVLIKGLGVGTYGLYALVLAVIGFGFTTGIGKVVAKYIPEYRSEEDPDSLSQVLSSTIVLTVGAALVESLILAVLAQLLASRVLNVPPEHQVELTIALWIVCVIGPVTMISQVFQSATQGLHRFRAFTTLTVIAAIAVYAGSIALVWLGYSYSAIILWNLIVAACTALAFFLYIRPRLPELRVSLKIDRPTISKVGRYAATIVAYQAITSVLFVFERMYVVRNFGSEMLSYYVVPLMLGIYLHALIVSFAQVVSPKMNEILREPDQLLELYKNTTRLVLAISTMILLVYFCAGREFLSLWLGEEFAARSYGLLIIHGLAFTVIAYSVISWILAEAIHFPMLNAISSFVTCAVAVVGMMILSNYYGISGVAVGRLAGAVIVLPFIFIVEIRAFGTPLVKFWLSNILFLTAATGLTLLASYALEMVGFSIALQFFLNAGVTAAVFLITLMLLRFISLAKLWNSMRYSY